MKTILLLSGIGCAVFSFGQTNTLPANGNVGIGTTSPSTKLQVNGSARIDSTLTVKDSIIVNKNAHVKSDLKIDGKATLKGDVVIKDGDFKLKSLADPNATEPQLLLIDANGKVVNGGEAKSLIYAEAAPAQLACKEDANGNQIDNAPYWIAGPGKIYVKQETCDPNPMVGIGITPGDAKLHIRTNPAFPNTKAIVVQNSSGVKAFQVSADGSVFAREVKVNMQSWPDYVFEDCYELMTLEQLQEYIEVNNHLPNIPSAVEIENSGVDLGNSTKILVEKTEENTLYILQLNKQIQELEKTMDEQQKLIESQQALILQLIEKTK